MLSERVLTQWRRLVFCKSQEPPTPGDAHGIVPLHRHNHQHDQQSGHFDCCRPGGHRGNMERVVAQWQHLVANIKVLDLFRWAMCVVLYHHTVMGIEMASNGGTFVRCSFV